MMISLVVDDNVTHGIWGWKSRCVGKPRTIRWIGMELAVCGNGSHIVPQSCSLYVSMVLTVCLNDTQGVPQRFSRYVPTVLTVNGNNNRDHDESGNQLLLQIHFVPELLQQFGQNAQQDDL